MFNCSKSFIMLAKDLGLAIVKPFFGAHRKM